MEWFSKHPSVRLAEWNHPRSRAWEALKHLRRDAAGLVHLDEVRDVHAARETRTRLRMVVSPPSS
jgi:hypothetical protein